MKFLAASIGVLAVGFGIWYMAAYGATPHDDYIENTEVKDAVDSIALYCRPPWYLSLFKSGKTCKRWVVALQEAPGPDDANTEHISVDSVKEDYAGMGKP